jgi:soluble lytic murein transglycosylase
LQTSLLLLRVSAAAALAIGVLGSAVAAAPDGKPALPMQQKLKAASQAEIDYFKELDGAIAPVRDLKVTADDAERIRAAQKALHANDLARLAAEQSEIGDPVAKKLVDWLRLRSGKSGTPAEIRAFLDKNPMWPERSLLTQRLEEMAFVQGGDPAAVRALFKDQPPKTGLGMAALASALVATGDAEGAKKLAAKAWREETIPGQHEAAFLQRFHTLLGAAEHKWRFDRLTVDDLRWAAERKERAEQARRIVPYLAEADQKRANARVAVLMRQANARALIEAAPADAADWGLRFHRIQSLRLAKRTDEAAQLMLSAPTDPAKTVNPDAWWAERRALAYAALTAGKAKLAYDLVKDAGPISVNPLKEQQFMAGWLAMRNLKDLGAAERHMEAMRKAADGPLSRAKSAYWLARIAEAKGDKAAARERYKAAAKETDTFHGMLARLKLEPEKRTLEITPPARPSAAEISKFNEIDAVKAAVVARRAGLDISLVRPFLYHLRNTLETEPYAALISHLAGALGDVQTGVRIAKTGIARGQNLYLYGYPTHSFPAYQPLRAPPETAFLLGIARQETEFNEFTVSGAGAKGLLQVMTVTANHVCRDYKIKCEIPRLLSDTSYNTMIASAYIADRMGEFGGSYVLGLAGYNAGPGRARQWIRQLGDPRDANVDPIDWIEHIPFQETREYVSKVLANVQMYRARIGESKPLRLDEDLVRARGSKAVPSEKPDEDTGAVAKSDD